MGHRVFRQEEVPLVLQVPRFFVVHLLDEVVGDLLVLLTPLCFLQIRKIEPAHAETVTGVKHGWQQPTTEEYSMTKGGDEGKAMGLEP